MVLMLPCRSLAYSPSVGLVSASHDTLLKSWDLAGSHLKDFIGHEAIIYTVALSCSSLIASGSEDKTVKVWHPDGHCLSTITHPSHIWSVTFISDFELISAVGDCRAYIWTTDTSNKADDEIMKIFEDSLNDESNSKGPVENLKMENISSLGMAGTSDGQIKIINDSGMGVAYSWDSCKGEWEKIGIVTGVNSEDGKFMNGKSYDYLIDVDIDDNMPPIKLGINNDDDPYEVADRFIADNQLPISYKDQIVQFIIQNTGICPPDPMKNVDPFTGTGVDKGNEIGRLFPIMTMLLFDKNLNVTAVRNKICEFNHIIKSEQVLLCLSDQDLASGGNLDQLLGCLDSFQKKTFDDHLINLIKKLGNWPPEYLFPIFDILRVIVLKEEFANYLIEQESLESIGVLSIYLAKGAACMTCKTTIQIMLRFVNNLSKFKESQIWLLSCLDQFFETLKQIVLSEDTQLQKTSSAVLLSLSIVYLLNKQIFEAKKAVSILVTALALMKLSSDVEVIERCIKVVGNLLSVAEVANSLSKSERIQSIELLNTISKNASQGVTSLAMEVLNSMKDIN